ncbi:MAG: hypothetical protein NPIRA01_15030 [Nitrospirales bacterium]|nr:MAG: hypothetical protein NPIRA01_15030 [Nitrospirales bacterium]
MKPLLEGISSQWPPPPHDPRDRTRVGRIDGWEVRMFSQHDTQRKYFVHKAFTHLQLWHPNWKVSVLTPSHLTGNFYELFPFRGAKLPICCITTVNNILQQQLEVPGIDPMILQFMEQYFFSDESLRTVPVHSPVKTVPYVKNRG